MRYKVEMILDDEFESLRPEGWETIKEDVIVENFRRYFGGKLISVEVSGIEEEEK